MRLQFVGEREDSIGVVRGGLNMLDRVAAMLIDGYLRPDEIYQVPKVSPYRTPSLSSYLLGQLPGKERSCHCSGDIN